MKKAIFLGICLSCITLSCTEDASTEPNIPADTTYIKIIEPKPGSKIKLNEKFKIVTESDYNKFGQKLTFTATTDSGKSWLAFILSLEPRTGMNVRDTVLASFDTLGFAVGEKTKIRVVEYGKVYSAVSDFIEIVP
jgi:hypothetical protein